MTDLRATPLTLTIALSMLLTALTAKTQTVPDSAATADNACAVDKPQDDPNPFDELRFTFALTANPIISDNETLTVGVSYHYAFSRWIAGGAEAGLFYHKYGIAPGDSLTVKRPYIAPSINLRIPLIIHPSRCFAIIPVIQAGVYLMPGYSIKVPVGDRLVSYRAHPASPYLRAGLGLAICDIMIHIGYSISTLDIDRRWDERQQRLHRGSHSHGIFIGIRIGL